MSITTTLAKIREHLPCKDWWKKLNENLGLDYGENTPLKFSQILESNGFEDAVCCLRSIRPEHDKEVRLFAADCAERVLHIFEDQYPKDDRPRKAIQAARDFAEGKITREELGAAANAAAAAEAAAATADAAGAAWRVAWAAVYVARAVVPAATACAAFAAATATADYDNEEKAQAEMLIKRFG